MTSPHHALTVAQVAECLGVSERTVWRYLKSGRLPGETVGAPGAQRTLIASAAVDALRRERRGPDGEEAAELRAEGARLVAELAAVQAERDALRARVHELQRALARPAAPSPVRRTLEGALTAATRLRAPRPLARRLGSSSG